MGGTLFEVIDTGGAGKTLAYGTKKKVAQIVINNQT